MDALLRGTLLRDGGCLYRQTADHELLLPVFVRGEVGWDGWTLPVAGEQVTVGDWISLGGGNTRIDDDGMRRAAVQLPTGCSASGQAFAVAPA